MKPFIVSSALAPVKVTASNALHVFREAALATVLEAGATLICRSRDDLARGAHASGKYPGFTSGGHTYVGTLRHLKGMRPWVRIYWRGTNTARAAKLECSVTLEELAAMAAWCVRFLVAADAGLPWPEPPVPVDEHLGTFGARCHYMWTNGGLRAYYADPRTIKGPLDGSPRDKRPTWLRAEQASGKTTS